MSVVMRIYGTLLATTILVVLAVMYLQKGNVAYIPVIAVAVVIFTMTVADPGLVREIVMMRLAGTAKRDRVSQAGDSRDDE